MPNINQTMRTIVQETKKNIEYGNMREINVPRPIFLSYYCTKAISIAYDVINDVMVFVDESAFRYAFCVYSVEYHNCFIIVTTTGAIIARYADELPMHKWIKGAMIINSKSNGIRDKIILFKNSAPYTPIMRPMFVSEKNATNCPAVNARTINIPMEAIVSASLLATSLSF